MLVRSLMTGGAGKACVVRYGLLPSDLSMTYATLTWDGRGLRRMGKVASHTWCSGVVCHRVDLWKTRRPGGVEGMADGAECPLPIDRGFGLHWGCHMVGGSTMTNFAGDPLMIGDRPNGFDVPMAEGALLAPGVHLLLVADGIHRGGPVMAKIPKGLRDQEVLSYDQRRRCQGEDHCETCDLLWHAVHPLRSGKETLGFEGQPRPNSGDPGARRMQLWCPAKPSSRNKLFLSPGYYVHSLRRRWGEMPQREVFSLSLEPRMAGGGKGVVSPRFG